MDGLEGTREAQGKQERSNWTAWTPREAPGRGTGKAPARQERTIWTACEAPGRQEKTRPSREAPGGRK